MKKLILFTISACLAIGVFAQNATVNKEVLATSWKAGDVKYTFDKNGTCVYTAAGRTCPGTWVLEGNTLTINPKKLMYKKADPCSVTRVYTIVSFTTSGLTLTENDGGKTLYFTKEK